MGEMIAERLNDGSIRIRGHSTLITANELPKWTAFYKRMADRYGHRSAKYAETHKALKEFAE